MQSWFYTTISLVLSAFYQAFGFLCSLFRVNVHLSEYTFLIMRPRNINHFFIILRINAYPFIFLTSSLLTFFVHGIDSNCSYNHISNISSLLFVCEEIDQHKQSYRRIYMTLDQKSYEIFQRLYILLSFQRNLSQF